MKLSSFIMMNLLIIISLFTFGLYANSLNDQSDINYINNSFTDKSDSLRVINQSTSKLQDSIQDIAEAREGGFLSVLAEGLYALPLALIELPILASTVVATFISDYTNALAGFAIHPFIILGLVVMTLAWLAFELLSKFTNKDI